MGTQKNHLNETVLLSTQNICYKSWVGKYLQCYAEFFGLSKPVSVQLVQASNFVNFPCKFDSVFNKIKWALWTEKKGHFANKFGFGLQNSVWEAEYTVSWSPGDDILMKFKLIQAFIVVLHE